MGKARGNGKGGRTPEGRETLPSIAAWERVEAGQGWNHEVGAVYTPDGRLVVRVEGDATGIEIPPMATGPGAILTHFHPVAVASLSGEDVSFAMANGMTVRAFVSDGHWVEVRNRRPMDMARVRAFRLEAKAAIDGATNEANVWIAKQSPSMSLDAWGQGFERVFQEGVWRRMRPLIRKYGMTWAEGWAP